MPFQFQSNGQVIDPMFQAAASIGQMHGRPDPMMDILNFNRQSQQQADQNVLQAQQLQAAHEQMLAGISARQQATAPTTGVRGMAPSFADTLQKKLIASSIEPDDLSPEQQKLVKDAVDRKDVTADHLRQAITPIIQANRQKKSDAAGAEKAAAISAHQAVVEKDKLRHEAEIQQRDAGRIRDAQKKERLGVVSQELSKLHSEITQSGAADLINVHGVTLAGKLGGIESSTKEKLMRYNQLQQERDRLTTETTPDAEGAAPSGKPIDPQTAVKFYQQAGGDPNKARDLARQAGYQF